jgi:peptidoglycan/LPS O-acetylase OafA/YrhL
MMFGTLVAANVLGVAIIANRLEWVLTRLARPIRAGAAFTFAIYLFHTPLLWFFLSLFKRTGAGRGSVLVMSCTLVACVALGMVTEQKKAVARRLLDHMFHWFDRASPQKPQPVEQEAA